MLLVTDCGARRADEEDEDNWRVGKEKSETADTDNPSLEGQKSW